MRSGIRSWSKWVIFSRRMKSSSSVGPRSPAFSEFWLSATGTPWLVVSGWPPESTRTRSSGPVAGLKLDLRVAAADLGRGVGLGKRAAADHGVGRRMMLAGRRSGGKAPEFGRLRGVVRKSRGKFLGARQLFRRAVPGAAWPGLARRAAHGRARRARGGTPGGRALVDRGFACRACRGLACLLANRHEGLLRNIREVLAASLDPYIGRAAVASSRLSYEACRCTLVVVRHDAARHPGRGFRASK